MTQRLNPFSGRQFLDASGDPYAGAKLFVYLAGTTTKATLTKDSAGLSNHTNPIILNTRGEPGDGAGASQAMWQTEGIAVKLVLAPSTDTDPPTSAISTWDNLSGVNDAVQVAPSEWVTGTAPTFVSATQFTLVNDQSTTYHVGRRLKTTNSVGFIYSTITAVAYTSVTTVTVVNDSGALDSGLSVVQYALLSAVNNTIPGGIHQAATAYTKTISWAKGADIASATALVLGADGNYFDVTGTTAITSIGTAGIGTVIKLHFDGALVLTHHATDLILPDSTNITTAAGDEAELIEHASGDWKLLNYLRTTTPKIQTADLEQTGGSEAVTQATIRDSAVGQAQLKSTTASGNVNVGITTAASYVLTGGTYAFWTASSNNSGGGVSFGNGDAAAGTIGVYNNSATSANIFYVDERYIQASPPYKLDDIVSLFVFIVFDGSGQIEAIRISEDPPWAYHGPTDIKASWTDKQDRTWRKEKKYIIDYYEGREPHVLDEFNNPTTRDRALQRMLIDSEMNDFEITLDFKNRDMSLIPHWWTDMDLTGKTVAMLDPTSEMAFQLMELKHASHAKEVRRIVEQNYLIFGRDPLSRITPEGVITVDAVWRNDQTD